MVRVTLFAAVIALTACRSESSSQTAKPELTVAAAANLTDVFQQLGPVFEQSSGIHAVFSFASTAQLTQQIENGAPFDVFTAADSTHIDELNRKGLLLPGSRSIYARGILALWIPPRSRAQVSGITDLIEPEVRFIAVAKPELAPYGQAAVEALTRAGIWKQAEPKIVYAENINEAKQFGQSKNADAVFTAYSLVLKESGKVIRVDESLYAPIDQALGIVANAQRIDEARKFTAFLLGQQGQSILGNHGYSVGTGR